MNEPKPYVIPDPRKRPDSFLTILYKTLRSVEYDDRAWDAEYFARFNKRTKYLLDVFSGDVQLAARCMVDLKEEFEAKGLGWTLETICEYSFEWKAKHSKHTDREMTQRFLGELAQQARVGELKRADVGTILTKIKELPSPQGEDDGFTRNETRVLREDTTAR